MTDIPVGQEVATYIDLDQFVAGRSVDTCGFATVVLNHYAGERGKPYGAPVAVLQQMQALYYSRFDGPDTPANHDGMTNAQLYQLIKDIGNHYQNLYPDGGVPLAKVKGELAYWIAQGYPVICAITESSVYDVELKGGPYAWNTGGLSHIITVTGMTASGNLLVRDTANVGRPGPREYHISPLVIYEATVFVPAWKARPYNAFNADSTHTTQVPIPKKPPAPTPPAPDAALAGIIAGLESAESALAAAIAKLKEYKP